MSDFVNRCEKHPNYKGIKPTKRDCSGCKAIFSRRQELERAKGGLFPSLTTQGQYFGVPHILAEMSCIMIFGNLPPYFWRKNVAVNPKIKSHYKTVMMGAKKWKFKNYPEPTFGNNPVKVFQKMLWYLVTRYANDEKMRNIHNAVAIKKEEVLKKDDTPISEKDVFFTPDNSAIKKTNKRQGLHDLDVTEGLDDDGST